MATTRMSRTDRAVGIVLGDLHAPYTDPKAWDWALGQVEEARKMAAKKKADFYLFAGNDWLDAEPVSPYGSEAPHDQLVEYEFAAKQSKELRKAGGPKARLVRLEGNHDKRLEADRPNVPTRLRSLTHWTRDPDLAPEWGRWETVPYVKAKEGSYRVGQVIVYHGFDINPNSDETEGLTMTWLHGAPSHCLTIRGHTHRPLDVTQSFRTKKVPLAHWYANAGTLGPLKPDWTYAQNTTLWDHAVVLFETKLREQGKCWEAETRTR